MVFESHSTPSLIPISKSKHLATTSYWIERITFLNASYLDLDSFAIRRTSTQVNKYIILLKKVTRA